jgi:hypothetical protein
MTHDNGAGAGVENLLDGWYGCPNAAVVSDVAGGILGHVKIDACKDALAAQVLQIRKGFLRHGLPPDGAPIVYRASGERET